MPSAAAAAAAAALSRHHNSRKSRERARVESKVGSREKGCEMSKKVLPDRHLALMFFFDVREELESRPTWLDPFNLCWERLRDSASTQPFLTTSETYTQYGL